MRLLSHVSRAILLRKPAINGGEVTHHLLYLSMLSSLCWPALRAAYVIWFDEPYGDRAKDQHGQDAIYQELSSSPSGIFDVNLTIAYGCCPGNCVMAADAIKAYLQSLLESNSPTYVAIPHELWPQDGT